MINFDSFKNITTNIQDADEHTIVFYKLNNSEKSISLFNERLKQTKSTCIFLYAFENYITTDTRISLVNENEFYKLQLELCDKYYPDWKKTKVIGVTGTNGKSTIVHLCQSILKFNKIKSYTIGTIGIRDGEKEIFADPGATTPSAIDLKRIFHHLSDYEYACLEVSSHALVQGRVENINFEVSGFTNLTQDHLDYHKTMEEYLDAKLLIRNNSKKLIICPDETDLAHKISEKNITYTIAKNIDVNFFSESFKMIYNQKNISLASALVNEATGIELDIPEDITLPKGRFNLFNLNESLFVVDYAHTPDAIFNLVSEARKSFPGYRIITVFGCGGDRDRLKRPKMLEAALSYSDKVIVTTDNPRFEDANQIISDIVLNKIDSKIQVIIDRKAAIENAVKDYPDKTIVLIAGKGHEEYQDVKGVKNHFSDIEEVLQNIKRVKNENQ